MLSDPISVTVAGTAKSLPRVGSIDRQTPRLIQRNTYATPDNAYSLETRQSEYRDGSRRTEITLRMRTFDTDVNTNYDGPISRGVGLVFETGPYKLGASDIASLRTDLLALVDSTLQGRLINGES